MCAAGSLNREHASAVQNAQPEKLRHQQQGSSQVVKCLQGAHEPEWDLSTSLHPLSALPLEQTRTSNGLDLLEASADRSNYVSLAELESAGSTPKACLAFESPQQDTAPLPPPASEPQLPSLDAFAFRTNAPVRPDAVSGSDIADQGFSMAAILAKSSHQPAEVRQV